MDKDEWFIAIVFIALMILAGLNIDKLMVI
jgi:hypothetical protein